MKIAHTKDTLSDIYLDAMSIRHHVFMVEQGVPRDIEIDKYEARCIHFVCYSDKDEAISTCRLLPLNESEMKLQRMAVTKKFRGKHFGQLVVKAAEDFAKEQNFNTMILDAQLTATGFYEKLGYLPQGEIFLDADMEHIKMTKAM